MTRHFPFASKPAYADISSATARCGLLRVHVRSGIDGIQPPTTTG